MKTLSVRDYYDFIAQDYDKLYFDAISVNENLLVNEMLISFLGKQKQEPKVLDLGCGTGLGLQFFRRYRNVTGNKFTYKGVDISKQMILLAKNEWYNENYAEFMTGDISKLTNFPDESFDVITSFFGSFSHATPYEDALNELERLTKPGGKVFLMVYSKYSLRELCNFFFRFKWGSLNFQKPYNVRNNKEIGSCNAYFYSNRFLKKELSKRGFGVFKSYGLNALLELPIVKNYILKYKNSVNDIFSLEQKILSIFPDLGHSLIITTIKNDSN